MNNLSKTAHPIIKLNLKGGLIMGEGKIYISSTSINIFNTCKRRFKYKYIDRITEIQRITNKYLSYGQSIHSALAQFNLISDERYKTLDMLQNLLRKNWKREGYESIDEERKFGLKALKVLENYFKNPLDSGTKNLIIEEMIKKDLDDKFVLSGKLDKVILNSDNQIEVIDYKSGDVIEYDESMPIDLQLAIYFILTHHKLKTYPTYISYYYLSHNKKISKKVSETEFKIIENLINNILEEIKSETEYPCSPNSLCERNCEYFQICTVFNEKNDFKSFIF